MNVCLSILVILVSYLFIYLYLSKYRKNSDHLIDVLRKNVEYLENYKKQQEVDNLRKVIKLYSQLQIIMKLFKCDYTSFFRYTYNKRYVELYFLLAIDNNGIIIKELETEKLPVISSFITLNIMKNNNKKFDFMIVENIKDKSSFLYESFKFRGVKKLYYKNIYKDDIPFGGILLSYKDEKYKISRNWYQ